MQHLQLRRRLPFQKKIKTGKILFFLRHAVEKKISPNLELGFSTNLSHEYFCIFEVCYCRKGSITINFESYRTYRLVFYIILCSCMHAYSYMVLAHAYEFPLRHLRKFLKKFQKIFEKSLEILGTYFLRRPSSGNFGISSFHRPYSVSRQCSHSYGFLYGFFQKYGFLDFCTDFFFKETIFISFTY